MSVLFLIISIRQFFCVCGGGGDLEITPEFKKQQKWKLSWVDENCTWHPPGLVTRVACKAGWLGAAAGGSGQEHLCLRGLHSNPGPCTAPAVWRLASYKSSLSSPWKVWWVLNKIMEVSPGTQCLEKGEDSENTDILWRYCGLSPRPLQ